MAYTYDEIVRADQDAPIGRAPTPGLRERYRILASLNAAHDARLNLDNHYENFAANLGVHGEDEAAFAAAVASLVGAKETLLAMVRDAGMVSDASTRGEVDIALKAAMAGLIMAASIEDDVGLYAAAANNFMVALSANTPVHGANVLRVGAVEVSVENYLAAIVQPEGRRRLHLTLTEFRILAHMARIPLRVFTRAELTEACFPRQDVSGRTVDSHISHLRRKLEAGGAPGLLENVRGVGYRLKPAE